MSRANQVTTTAPAPSDMPTTTGGVARLLGVTEQRVQTVLRRAPEVRPPLVGGKRQWRPEDVRAMRAALESTTGGAR